MNTKLYASMVINGSEGWGDGLPVLWIAEHLYARGDYQEIHLWDGGNRELANYKRTDKFFHRDYIEKPHYIHSFIDGPPDERRFDKILATSFYTPHGPEWAVPPFRDPVYNEIMTPALYIDGPPPPSKFLYLEINNTSTHLLRSGFKPTLPDVKNNQIVENAVRQLGDFVCLVFRKNDPWKFDAIYDAEFDNWQTTLVERALDVLQENILILSDFPPQLSPKMIKGQLEGRLVDGTKFPLWGKMYCSSFAKRSAVAHSGFGLMLSGYQGLDNTMVVNAIFPSGRNPPLMCFANGDYILEKQDATSTLDIEMIVSFLAGRKDNFSF